jgi:predicted 3-demethylubiquinone-9 3-methyltransferase (glyoxalase superfamily)
MSTRFQRISPFLWFNDQAEVAAAFYVSIFDNSRILASTHFSSEAAKASGRPEGSVMTIAFELDGQAFVALNGGPAFTFNPALSLVVNCRDQHEVDRYWNALSEGGDPRAQQCGWLQDRFGLSWQIVPVRLFELLNSRDAGKAQRAMQAVLAAKKIDIAALEQPAA